MENKRRKENGITLVALIVTIIIMLILAAVSINLAVGNGGVIGQAQNAKKSHEEVAYEENRDQQYLEYVLKGEDKYHDLEVEDNKTEHLSLDVTELEEGDELEHTHIFESKYDTQYHWKECFICGAILDKKAHSLQTTWLNGNSHCSPYNQGTTICTDKCGYSHVGAESHVIFRNGGYTNWQVNAKYVCKTLHCDAGQYRHYRHCSPNGDGTCSCDWIAQGCRKADGTAISCGNPGVCVVCGHNYSTPTHTFSHTNCGTYDLSCSRCGKRLFHVVATEAWSANKLQKTVNVAVTPLDNQTMNITYMGTWSNTGGYSLTEYTKTLSGKTYNLKYVFTLTGEPYQRSRWAQCRIGGTIGSHNFDGQSNIVTVYLNPDTTAPTITDVHENKKGVVNGWVSGTEIVVSGKETYSDIVYIRLEQNGKLIYPPQGMGYDYSTVNVVNGDYSYSFSPELEANENTKYSLIVMDRIGNKFTKDIYLSQIDSKAPVLKNAVNKVLYYTGNTQYERYRQITLQVTDEGSGEVEFAFNDPNNFTKYMSKEGNTYIYTYRCGGNVYDSDIKGVAIYLRDKAGNVATYGLRVDKIDQTEPKITNVAINGRNITIEANDKNEKLGRVGSGIVGYAYSKYPNWYPDLTYTSSPSFEITKPGTYYAFAKDNAGNFSAGYEFKID